MSIMSFWWNNTNVDNCEIVLGYIIETRDRKCHFEEVKGDDGGILENPRYDVQ